MIKFVDGAKYWYRYWSTWLVTFGTAVVGFTPELMDIYRNLPVEVQATFPEEWLRYFGLTLVVLSVPAKLIRQTKLHDKVNRDREL